MSERMTDDAVENAIADALDDPRALDELAKEVRRARRVERHHRDAIRDLHDALGRVVANPDRRSVGGQRAHDHAAKVLRDLRAKGRLP